MKRKTEKKIKIKELEYLDPIEAFKRLQDYNDLIFFDSASKSQKNNRYSYIALDPVQSYKVSKQGRKSIFDTKTEIEIKKIYKKISFKKKNRYPSFQCGFAGYITYDQCLSIENINSIIEIKKVKKISSLEKKGKNKVSLKSKDKVKKTKTKKTARTLWVRRKKKN